MEEAGIGIFDPILWLRRWIGSPSHTATKGQVGGLNFLISNSGLFLYDCSLLSPQII